MPRDQIQRLSPWKKNCPSYAVSEATGEYLMNMIISRRWGDAKKRGKELWLTCWEIRWKRSWCKWPPSNNQTPQHHFEWNFSWYQEMTPTSLSFSFPPTRTKVWTHKFTVVADVSSQTHHEAESWHSHKIIHKVLSASVWNSFTYSTMEHCVVSIQSHF